VSARFRPAASAAPMRSSDPERQRGVSPIDARGSPSSGHAEGPAAPGVAGASAAGGGDATRGATSLNADFFFFLGGGGASAAAPAAGALVAVSAAPPAGATSSVVAAEAAPAAAPRGTCTHSRAMAMSSSGVRVDR